MTIGLFIGGLIGLMLRGIPGLLMGAVLGYFLAKPIMGALGKTQVWQVRRAFLDSTFSVMGAVCKADGVVSDDEIRVVERLFAQLRLDAEGREDARRAFNRGKAAGFDLDTEVARFATLCRGQAPLLNMFLQMQLAAVAADGAVHAEEHALLVRIARGLGLSEADVQRMEAALRGGGRGASQNDIAAAYATLGVPVDASDSDVRQAYRRLMSENHPDKLAAKGLPESMRPVAEEKTRNITAAYDRIKTSRG
jgi:DnaJ like chaperone protein